MFSLWNGFSWVFGVLEKGNSFCTVCARASDLESGSAFEISNSKIKNLEKSSILFNMRSFLKEKMEKHVEDLWQFETTVFWSCQRKMFSDNLRSICVFSLVERRIYRTSASTSREIFRLARQAQVHFIRRRPRRICLACHAQIQVVRRRPRTISYRPPEAVTLWRAQPAWGSAAAPPGKIRVRACARTRCGQNVRARVRVRVSVSPTAIEFSCHPPEAMRRFSCPSKCLGIGLGGFTPLILFLISTSCLGLEMFRDRIRGVNPPNSIPILNKHNNELNAVCRRPRTNSYHPSETKNYLMSSVGDQGIFVLACHAQKVRVTPGLGLGYHRSMA